MYIKQAISNICERYNAKDFHILYEPLNNLFDLCINNLSHKIFTENNFIYQYNFSVCNNILKHAQNSNNNSYLGLNTICCVHSYKPINLKKEDLYLIDQNLTNTYKIFFSSGAQKSWNINSNTNTIPYGIPDMFTNLNIDRKYVVGLFDNGNNESTKLISSILKEQNISYKILSNYSTIVSDMNECLYTIEMNEINIINSLCSRACGCVNLMPMSKDIQENFSNDIITFRDIPNMLSLVKQSTESNVDINGIKNTYSYSSFKNNMYKIFEQANNEVCLI